MQKTVLTTVVVSLLAARSFVGALPDQGEAQRMLHRLGQNGPVKSGALAFVLPDRPRVDGALAFVLPDRPRVDGALAFVLPDRPRVDGALA